MEQQHAPEEQEGKNYLREILSILMHKTGVDLLHYKHTTLQRRVTRRQHMLNMTSTDDYLAFLRQSEQEQHQLYKEMLIHVSAFFRDEKSFDYLCADVLPAILKDKREEETIRVWVCGCSTGEEAYSIAICLHEHAETIGNLSRIKIFASDLSENAIAKARHGVYAPAMTARIPEARLQKYFMDVPGGKKIQPFIRDMCTFAVHNVLSHPPFAQIDLLSCRNVLIYMQPLLQKKVLATFSYALKENGYLFLGKSETSGLIGKFEPINKSANIYINKVREPKLFTGSNGSEQNPVNLNHQDYINTMGKKDFQTAADELLLSKYVPAGVVVSDEFEIVDFRGATGFYIEPSPGIASFNVLKMVRKGLYYELHEALNKVKAEKIAVKKENIALEHDGKLLRITLEVLPLTGTKDKYYLILFHNMTLPGEHTSTDGINDTQDLRILQLEQELMQSREQLRALSEEQEATNEEFQSANEELKTLNEELQTSQEEVISINEELVIRNKELNVLNEEVNIARRYSESINNTISTAIVILDLGLRVKSANRSFYETFETSVEETEGELFFEIGNGHWNIPELKQLIDEVKIRKNTFSDFVVSKEFARIGERVMGMNAREIKGGEKVAGLILLAIEDITELHRASEAIRRQQDIIAVNEERQRLAIKSNHFGIWDYELSTDVLYFSDEAAEILGSADSSVQGWKGLLQYVHPEDRAIVSSAIEVAVSDSEDGYFSMEYRIVRPEDRLVKWVNSSGKALFDEQHRMVRFTGIISDVSERKDFQSKLEETVVRLNLALQAGQIGSWEILLDGNRFVTSPQFNASVGLPPLAELSLDDFLAFISAEEREEARDAIQEAIISQQPYNAQYAITWPDNSVHWIELAAMMQFEEDGRPHSLVGVGVDITSRKLAEQKLEYSEHHFRTLANSSPVMVAMSDKEGNFYFFNRNWQKFVGIKDATMKKNQWSSFMHPDDLENFVKIQSEAIKRHLRYTADLRLRTMGKYRWVTCIAEPRFGVDNKFSGYTMACIDIHDQKMISEELERKVEERTGALRDLNEDLQDKNRELKQFAYVTSHDLQEPLRKIKMFTSMLLARDPKDNASLADYLRRIEFSAGRMIGLIHDLLNYSSLQDRQQAFTTTDLNHILQNVVGDFDLLIQEKNAVLSIGSLPVIDAVPLQMNQLFYNLIGNALKFSRPGQAPHIRINSNRLTPEEVAAHMLDENLEYFCINISDNGIGFGAEFNDRIFEIFQRLHERDSYTGNGIGLAFCKRIVTNHGGLILPHSVENEGTTFEVILPGKH